MDLIVKFLFLSGKYITCAAGKTILEIINHSVKIQRHVARKYDHATQMVGPYDNMLELMNARIEDNSAADIATPETRCGSTVYDISLNEAFSDDSATIVPPVPRQDHEYERIFQDLYEDLRKSSTELKSEMMTTNISRCDKTLNVDNDVTTEQPTTMQHQYIMQHFYGTCPNDCSANLANFGGSVPLCDRYAHMNSLISEAPDDSYFKKHDFTVREKKSINVHSSARIYNFKKALLAHDDTIDLSSKDFITDLKREIHCRTFSTKMTCGKYHQLQSRSERLSMADSCRSFNTEINSSVCNSAKCCKRQSSWQAFESNLERKLQKKIYRIINRNMSNNHLWDDDEVEKQNQLQANLIKVNEVAFNKLEQKVTQILIQQNLKDIEEVFCKKNHLQTSFTEVKRMNFDEICSNTSARIQNAVIKGLKDKRAQMMPTGIGDITDLMEEQIRPALFETRHGDFVSTFEDVLRLREAPPLINIAKPLEEQHVAKKIEVNPDQSKSDIYPVAADIDILSGKCSLNLLELMANKALSMRAENGNVLELMKTDLTDSDMEDIQQRTNILESNWRAFKIFEEYLHNVMVFDKTDDARSTMAEEKSHGLFRAFNIEAIYNSFFNKSEDENTDLKLDEINMKFIEEGQSNPVQKLPPLVHPDVEVIPSEILVSTEEKDAKDTEVIAIKEDIAIKTEKAELPKRNSISYLEILSERERQHLEVVKKSIIVDDKEPFELPTADSIKQPSLAKSIRSDFIVGDASRCGKSSKILPGCVSDFIVACAENHLNANQRKVPDMADNEEVIEKEEMNKSKVQSNFAENESMEPKKQNDCGNQSLLSPAKPSSQKPNAIKEAFTWAKESDDHNMADEQGYNAQAYSGNECILNEVDIEDTNDVIESLHQELYNQQDSVEPFIADIVTRLWDKPTDYLTLDPIDANALLFPESKMHSQYLDSQYHNNSHEVYYDEEMNKMIPENYPPRYNVPEEKLLNLEKELMEIKTQLKSLSNSSVITKYGLDVVNDGNISEYILNTPKHKEIAEISKSLSDTNIAISAGKPKKIHLNIYLPKNCFGNKFPIVNTAEKITESLMYLSKSNPQLIQQADVKQISNYANNLTEEKASIALSIDPDRIQKLKNTLQLKTVDIERLCKVQEGLTPSPVIQQQKAEPKSIDMDRLFRVHENLTKPKSHIPRIDIDKLLNLQRNLKQAKRISAEPISVNQVDINKMSTLCDTLQSIPANSIERKEIFEESSWKPMTPPHKFKFNVNPSYLFPAKQESTTKEEIGTKECKEIKENEAVRELKTIKEENEEEKSIRAFRTIKEEPEIKKDKESIGVEVIHKDIVIQADKRTKKVQAIRGGTDANKDKDAITMKTVRKGVGSKADAVFRATAELKETNQLQEIKEFKLVNDLKEIKEVKGIKDLVIVKNLKRGNELQPAKVDDTGDKTLSIVRVVDAPKLDVSLSSPSSKTVESGLTEIPDTPTSTVRIENEKAVPLVMKQEPRIPHEEVKVALQDTKPLIKPLEGMKQFTRPDQIKAQMLNEEVKSPLRTDKLNMHLYSDDGHAGKLKNNNDVDNSKIRNFKEANESRVSNLKVSFEADTRFKEINISNEMHKINSERGVNLDIENRNPESPTVKMEQSNNENKLRLGETLTNFKLTAIKCEKPNDVINDKIKEELRGVLPSSGESEISDTLRVKYNENKEIGHVVFKEETKSHQFFEKIFNNSDGLISKIACNNVSKPQITEIEINDKIDTPIKIKQSTTNSVTSNDNSSNNECNSIKRNIFAFIPNVKQYGDDVEETPYLLQRVDTKIVSSDNDRTKGNALSSTQINASSIQNQTTQKLDVSCQQSRKICDLRKKDDADNDIEYIIDKNSARSNENRRKYVRQEYAEEVPKRNVQEYKSGIQMARTADEGHFNPEDNEEEEYGVNVFGRRPIQAQKGDEQHPDEIIERDGTSRQPEKIYAGKNIKTASYATGKMFKIDFTSEHSDIPPEQPKEQSLNLMKLPVDIEDNPSKHRQQNTELFSPLALEEVGNSGINIVLDKIDDTDALVNSKTGESKNMDDSKSRIEISLNKLDDGFREEAASMNAKSDHYVKSNYFGKKKLTQSPENQNPSDFFKYDGHPPQQSDGSSDGDGKNNRKPPDYITDENLSNFENKRHKSKPNPLDQETRSETRYIGAKNPSTNNGKSNDETKTEFDKRRATSEYRNERGKRIESESTYISKKPPVFQFRPEKADFRTPEINESEEMFAQEIRRSQELRQRTQETTQRQESSEMVKEFSDENSSEAQKSKEEVLPKDSVAVKETGPSRHTGESENIDTVKHTGPIRDIEHCTDTGTSRDADYSRDMAYSKDVSAKDPAHEAPQSREIGSTTDLSLREGLASKDAPLLKESPIPIRTSKKVQSTREVETQREVQKRKDIEPSPKQTQQMQKEVPPIREVQVPKELHRSKGTELEEDASGERYYSKDQPKEVAVPKEFNQSKESDGEVTIKFDVNEPFTKKISFEYKPFNPSNYLEQENASHEEKNAVRAKVDQQRKLDVPPKPLGNACKVLIRSDAEVGRKSTEKLQEEFEQFEAKFVALGRPEVKNSVEITKHNKVKYELQQKKKVAPKGSEYKPYEQPARYSSAKLQLKQNQSVTSAENIGGFQKIAAPKKMEQVYIRKPSRPIKSPDEKPPLFEQQQQQQRQHRQMPKNPLPEVKYKLERPAKLPHPQSKMLSPIYEQHQTKEIKEKVNPAANNAHQQLMQQHLKHQHFPKKTSVFNSEKQSENPQQSLVHTKKPEIDLTDYKSENLEQSDSTKELQNILQKQPTQHTFENKNLMNAVQQKAQMHQEFDSRSLGDKVQQQLESLDKMVKELPKQTLHIAGKKGKEQTNNTLSQDQLQNQPQLPSQPQPNLSVAQSNKQANKQNENVSEPSSKDQLQTQPQLPSEAPQQSQTVTLKQSHLKAIDAQDKENQEMSLERSQSKTALVKSFEFKPLRETQQYYKDEVLPLMEAKPKHSNIIKSYEFNYMDSASPYRQEKPGEDKKVVKKKVTTEQSCESNIKIEERKIERNENKKIIEEKKTEIKRIEEISNPGETVSKRTEEHNIIKKPEERLSNRKSEDKKNVKVLEDPRKPPPFQKPINKVHEELVAKRSENVQKAVEGRQSEEIRRFEDVDTRSEDAKRSVDAARSEMAKSNDTRRFYDSRRSDEKKVVSVPNLTNPQKQHVPEDIELKRKLKSAENISKCLAESRSAQQQQNEQTFLAQEKRQPLVHIKSSQQTQVEENEIIKEGQDNFVKLTKSTSSTDFHAQRSTAKTNLSIDRENDSVDLNSQTNRSLRLQDENNDTQAYPTNRVTKEYKEEFKQKHTITHHEYTETEEDLMKPKVQEKELEASHSPEDLYQENLNDRHKIDRSVLSDTSWLKEKGRHVKPTSVDKSTSPQKVATTDPRPAQQIDVVPTILNPPTEVESPKEETSKEVKCVTCKNYFPKKSYNPVDYTLSIAETIKWKEMQAKARANIDKTKSAPYVFEHRQPVQYNRNPDKIKPINCDHLGIVWPKPKTEEKATTERAERNKIFTTPPTLEMSTSAVLDRQASSEHVTTAQDDERDKAAHPMRIVYSFDDKYRKVTDDREIQQKKIDYWKALQREDKWAPIPTELTIANELYGSRVLMKKQQRPRDEPPSFQYEYAFNDSVHTDQQLKPPKKAAHPERQVSARQLKRQLEEEEEDKKKYGNISPLLKHYLKQKEEKLVTIGSLQVSDLPGKIDASVDLPKEYSMHRIRDDKKPMVINIPAEGNIFDKYPLLRKDYREIEKKKKEEEELAARQAEHSELMRVEQQKEEAEKLSAQAALLAEERCKAYDRKTTFGNQTAVKFKSDPYANKLSNMMKWKMRYNAHIEKLNTPTARPIHEENRLVRKFPFLRKYRKASEQIYWPEVPARTNWNQYTQLPYNPSAAAMTNAKPLEADGPSSVAEAILSETSSGHKKYVFEEKNLTTTLGKTVKVTYLVEDPDK